MRVRLENTRVNSPGGQGPTWTSQAVVHLPKKSVVGGSSSMKAGGWKHAGTLDPRVLGPRDPGLSRAEPSQAARSPFGRSGAWAWAPRPPCQGQRSPAVSSGPPMGPSAAGGCLCAPVVEQVKPGRLHCAGLFLCCWRSAILWGFLSLQGAETPTPSP